MLKIENKWVWDHWIYDSGEDFHIFFLQANKNSLDASTRHLQASIGHAVSKDLKNWQLLPTALEKSKPGKWDDVATWTGSVVKNPDSNFYYMFYTGVTKMKGGLVQRIGCATSPDLLEWKKLDQPLLSANPDFYGCQETGDQHTDFRDPWVFFNVNDQKWHMLITAMSNKDRNPKSRGIVGHAESTDLLNWKILPPLAQETTFGQTEVLQVVEEEGKYVGIFCCGESSLENKPSNFKSATYSVPMDSAIGPFHFNKAQVFDADSIYAGRIIRDRSGVLNLLGFVNAINDAEAPCFIPDPIQVQLTESGNLQVLKKFAPI